MPSRPRHQTTGPCRTDQLRTGDPYELDNGHPIERLPGCGRCAKANLSGGLALETDPAVTSAGFDTRFATDEHSLRAPDLAVGKVPDEHGRVRGVPPLAVEYANVGQDEADLQAKTNPPIEALYDPEAAHEAALRNLLQRRRYMDSDAVREKGRDRGREEGEIALVLRLLGQRIGAIAPGEPQDIRALDRDCVTALSASSGRFSEPRDLAAWLARKVSI